MVGIDLVEESMETGGVDPAWPTHRHNHDIRPGISKSPPPSLPPHPPGLILDYQPAITTSTIFWDIAMGHVGGIIKDQQLGKYPLPFMESSLGGIDMRGVVMGRQITPSPGPGRGQQ